MKTHTETGTFYAVEMRGPQDTEPTLVIGADGGPGLFSSKRNARDARVRCKRALPDCKFRVVPVEVTFRWEAKP